MDTKANEIIREDSPKSRNALETETDPESIDNSDPVYSYEEQRAIVHRIDRRLVVTCGLLYCVSLIDRGNLGNASIAGWVMLIDDV